MFEYLMPLLVMRRYEGTLLDETYDAAVARQMEYGARRGVPWGISESAYNTLDLALNYQYRAFGVPGLGLKSGLAEDLVVSPYSTVMALMVDPTAAVANLRALASEGMDGRYGFFEAIDYTAARVPPGRRSVIVRSFMAHHQGMSLVAMDNVLHGEPMVRRFHADPRIRATELLLQERVPGPIELTAPAGRGGGVAVDDPGRPRPDRSGRPARRADPRDDAAVERDVFGHAHGVGGGREHLSGSGDHALARGRDARPGRHVLLHPTADRGRAANESRRPDPTSGRRRSSRR